MHTRVYGSSTGAYPLLEGQSCRSVVVTSLSALILSLSSVYLSLSLQCSGALDTQRVLLLCTALVALACVVLSEHDVVTLYCTLVFTLASVVLLCTTSWVMLVLAFEALNLPLAVLLVYRSSGVHTGTSYVTKGTLLSLLLLLVYGVVSGTLLWCGTSIGVGSGLYTVASVGAMQHGVGSWCLALAAAVKVALVPTHVWLGKVHVESSTVGSVLLAGIALKAGWYLHVLVLPTTLGVSTGLHGVYLYLTLVLLVGGLYTSVVLMRQTDTKRWVAMYSVTHMQVFYGIWLASGLSTELTAVLNVGMLAHSLLASALFVLVGSLAECYGTRQWSDLPSSAVRTGPLLVGILLNGSVPSSPILLVELTALGSCSTHSLVLSGLLLGVSATSLVSGLYAYQRASGVPGLSQPVVVHWYVLGACWLLVHTLVLGFAAYY